MVVGLKTTGSNKMDIQTKINKLVEMEKVNKKTIENIRVFWVDNVGVIGRQLGDFELESLEYSNAYGGQYDEYILYRPDQKAYMLGHGYEGWQNGCGYNTFSVERADREIHLLFLRTFKALLIEKLDQLGKQEEDIFNFSFVTFNKA